MYFDATRVILAQDDAVVFTEWWPGLIVIVLVFCTWGFWRRGRRGQGGGEGS